MYQPLQGFFQANQSGLGRYRGRACFEALVAGNEE
jgi:hypothetical protein